MIALAAHSIPTLLSRLEHELRTARDFAVPFRTFDALVTTTSFLDECRIGSSPLLEGVLGHLARKLDGPRTRWEWSPCVLRHAEGAIVHGIARIGGRHCALFHLERADLGLAAVVGPGPTEVHHARFSAVVVPRNAVMTHGRGAA